MRDGERDPSPSFQDAIRAAVADLRWIVTGVLGGLDVAVVAADVERALGELGSAPVTAAAADSPTASAPARGDAGELLRAIAAAQLATLRLTALQAGVEPAALPEYAALAALLGAAPGPARRGSVLVVEDSATQRERHRAILADGGYDVRTAADGAEALALLEREPVDAVVTDLEMPAIDGWQLTRTIRTHPDLAGIGIVVVSSRTDDDARRRSAGAGADAFLAKTVDAEELLGLVQRVTT